MCISKAIIKVAIYGASATGKSALSEVLKDHFEDKNMRIRHCGDAVRDRAKLLGLKSLSQLNKKDHDAIDDETRRAIFDAVSIIVEGRYLHYVLSGINDVVYVSLNCSLSERAARIARRNGLPLPRAREIIVISDAEDRQLIQKVYGNPLSFQASHVILDTTKLTIAQTADRVIEAIKSHYDETK